MKPSEDFLIDRRVVERHIDRGLLTREEFEKALAALKDAADHAVVTSIPIVKVSARKSVLVKPAPAPVVEDSMYDIDDDDDEAVD